MIRNLFIISLITVIQATFLEISSPVFLIIPIPLIVIYLWQYSVSIEGGLIMLIGHLATLFVLKYSLLIIFFDLFIGLATAALVYLVLAQKSLYGLLFGSVVLFLLNFSVISIFSQQKVSILVLPLYIIIFYLIHLSILFTVKNIKVYG